ncbi:hypothetical protein RCL1_005032 [Eukaryota sp. TZLM3-RCL]
MVFKRSSAWGPSRVVTHVSSPSVPFVHNLVDGVSSENRSKKPSISAPNPSDDTQNDTNTDHLKTPASVTSNRLSYFKSLLSADFCSVTQLQKESWVGIPSEVRGEVWSFLLFFYPADNKRRRSATSSKVKEYHALATKYTESLSQSNFKDSVRQISVDLIRTCPDLPFIQLPSINSMLSRILFVYAVRHSGAGYVQGMNDLAIPFLITLILSKTNQSCDDYQSIDISTLTEQDFVDIEAQLYLLFEKFMEKLESLYINDQRGFSIMVQALEHLISRCSHTTLLYNHWKSIELKVNLFAFRWMSCLLLRELPYSLGLRLFDTYLSERDYPGFHVFVCMAVLIRLTPQLLSLDFPNTMMFIQNIKSITNDWSLSYFEEVISLAYVLYTQQN